MKYDMQIRRTGDLIWNANGYDGDSYGDSALATVYRVKAGAVPHDDQRVLLKLAPELFGASGGFHMSVPPGRMPDMSTDLTKIKPADLATAAGKAAATQAASTPAPIEPPASGSSPVDAAPAAVAQSIQALLAAQNTADTAAAAEQTAALTESPPALVQQDQTNADNMNTAGAGVNVIKLPTPVWNA